MRTTSTLLFPFLLGLGIPGPTGGDLVLPQDAPAPADYVLQKLEQHPLVILGEAHWIRHDAQLVASLVPSLAQRGVTLGLETLQGDDQPLLDRLLAAEAWNAAEAMQLQRRAAWPYREYLEILRAAWEANHASPGSVRLLALSPPLDFRDKKVSYEGFMADRVAAEVESGRKVLVYCGLHHAFTRYHQPELDAAGKARAFIDRMGNLLRRRFGERVFLITLHRPEWCGKEPWDYCLPLGGALDCAAARLGRPVGFDVDGTPLGDAVVDPAVYYAHGYAALRFGEMTDGYVWTRPLEEYEDVRLIPLDEFAPDEAARIEVAANIPFSNEKDASRARLEELWAKQTERRADPLTHRRWKPLVGWRERCAP